LSAQRFLYKTAAEKNCDTVLTTFAFFATVAVLSTVFFAVGGAGFENPGFLVIVSLVNSASFTVATIAHMESLKHVPAAESYSIIRLNVVLVALFSIVYFDDRLSMFQVAGIVLAVAVIGILANGRIGRGGRRDLKRGFALVFLSLFAGAAASISSKFAATGVDKFAFISLTYIFSAAFSFILKNRLFKRESPGDRGTALKVGVWMGLLNIGGYYAFLRALETGPLSVIATITGMHFVVAIVLSAVIYKEKIDKRQSAGVVLTLVSVALLRM
jgi:drug/metabolite transporter (DMT)-like permease